MSITTSATIPWTVDNTTGNQYYKLRYRQSGTTVWNMVTTSGTTATVSGLAINTLYDFQVVNVNGGENPASAVSQSINITDPYPLFFPTNTNVYVEFQNLSEDIDTYTVTIAPFSSPGTILDTQVLSPADPVSCTFADLQSLTQYVITITPAANQFYKTFSYTVTTKDIATCVGVQNVVATLS